ncbi:acyl-CoA dehydrogenase family protein [Enemella sp. A6]|uniref:acyl-CoA dehydrogenase family protein n=1 Tax=Enemella sp. A6 TaxID=3440152 RepID=UPI003EBEA084
MKLVESTEERDLRGVLRSLFTTHCPPELVREQRSADAPRPEALWRELHKVGVFELAADDQPLDGIGSSLDALGLLAEEAGRALCPDIVLSTVVFGLAAQHLVGPDDLLDALAEGELAATYALWQPGDAHRPAHLRAEPTPDGGWVLSGELHHVPAATQAELVLVAGHTDTDTDPARTLITALPLSEAQITSHEAMGGSTSTVRFDRIPVSEAQVWAHADIERVRWVAHAALALQAREIAGGCQAVIERTVAYVGEREQFGRAIGTFQAVQHHIADMHIATAAARLAAARATFWVGRGEQAGHEVATATMKSSDAYPFVTLTAHQLHGGMGYVRESDLHLWSERAVVLRARGGDADVAATWLAEEVGL